MMKTILASATFAAALATFAVVGCGSSTSSTNNNGTGEDSGAGGHTGGDSGSGGGVVTPGRDAGPAADAAPATLPDGSVLPHGNQLVQGATLSVLGVTSDDQAIYYDSSNKTAYAIALAAGSKPTSLGVVADSSDVTVSGKVVFLGTSDSQGVGAASIWTSAASAPAPLATATSLGSYAVSTDGSHVAYLDSIDTTAGTAALIVAASDGTGKATLVGTLDVGNVSSCFPQFSFAGASVVASYCPITAGVEVDAGEPDGGTNVNVATVTAFTSPAWTPVPLTAGVQSALAVDATGAHVALNGPAGTIVVPVAGGAAVTVDATGELGGATSSPGIFTKDGSHLLYTTTSQALERAATTAPAAPVQLAAAGTFADVFTLSPDEAWVIGSLNPNSAAFQDDEGDLFLSSSSTAGTPVALSSAATGGIFGDAFTADSTHVLFYTNVSKGVGSLNVQAVTGATPTVLGAKVWVDYVTAGAKVLYNDNYASGFADLRSIDTSTAAAATLLVTQADANFFTNSAKTTIVYTWSYDTEASQGLWTLPAP